MRFIAQGRDPSATIDSAIGGVYSTLFPAPPTNPPGFFNDGDNEITGIHVSDGDPTKNGILGAKSPNFSASRQPFRENNRSYALTLATAQLAVPNRGTFGRG